LKIYSDTAPRVYLYHNLPPALLADIGIGSNGRAVAAVKACGRKVTVLDALHQVALNNRQSKIAGKPLRIFHFSSNSEHRAPNVVISPDRLTAKRSSLDLPVFACARSEQGAVVGFLHSQQRFTMIELL
jgi:hypothetical protein